MTKRRKASIIMTGRRRSLRGFRKVVNILTGTFHASCTERGVICLSGSGAGVTAGTAFLSVDTAGTGTALGV